MALIDSPNMKIQTTSPYFLSLAIEKAEDLAVFDITTSDPFVTISIGEIFADRTRTIYRNLNPEWNETFTIPILKTSSILKLRIFDEDLSKDDLMGIVTVDLVCLKINKMESKICPVLNIDGSDGKGVLYISLRLTESDSIKVIPMKKDNNRDPNFYEELSEHFAVDIQEEDIMEPVKLMLEDSSYFNKLKDYDHADQKVLRDILHDVCTISFESSIQGDNTWETPEKSFKRRHRQLCSSTSIDILSKYHSREPPHTQILIYLHLATVGPIVKEGAANNAGSRVIALVFSNHFTAWSILKWLHLGREVAEKGGRVEDDNLPTWAAEAKGIFNMKYPLNIVVDDVEHRNVTLALSLSPFELQWETQQTRTKARLDLSTLTKIRVTVDTTVPSQFFIDIESVSVRNIPLTGEAEDSMQVLYTATEAAKAVERSEKGSSGRVQSPSPPSPSSAADPAQHFQAAVYAAKRLSIKMASSLSYPQSPPLSPSKIARIRTSDALAVLLKSGPYMCKTTSKCPHKGDRSIEWEVGTDFDRAIFDVGDAAGRDPVFASDEEAGRGRGVAINATGSLEVHLLAGSTFLCSQRLSFSRLVRRAGDCPSKRGVNTEILFPLKPKAALSIELVKGSGIVIDDSIGTAIRGLFVIATFVDWQGSNRDSIESKSNSVRISVEPTWNGQELLLPLGPEMMWAEYVRLELFIGGPIHQFTVGAAFVPIDHFKSSEQTKSRVYPVVGFGSKSGTPNHTLPELLVAGLRKGSIPTLTVQLHRIHEQDDDEDTISSLPPVTARICYAIREEFSSEWPVDAISLEALDSSSSPTVESFSFIPEFDNLSLRLSESDVITAALSNVSEKKENTTKTPPPSIRHSSLTKSKSPSSHTSSSWRDTALRRFPDAILHSCRERTHMDSAFIHIPYNQVSWVAVCTPSVLQVRVVVHTLRGGGGSAVLQQNDSDDDDDSGAYRSIDIDLFVQNCTAEDIKYIVNERILFASYRPNVVVVLSSNAMVCSNLDFNEGAGFFIPEEKCDTMKDSPRRQALQSPASGSESDMLGTQAAYDIEIDLGTLKSESSRLQRAFEETKRDAYLADKRTIDFRATRLCLYLATLLGAGLKCRHNFAEEDIHSIIESDISEMAFISERSEILTIEGKLQFLLERAEIALREAAYCGWKHRGGRFEAFVGKLTNKYLISMSSLLAKFFEGDKSIQHVKGLTGKTKIIVTFMSLDDRLDSLLEGLLPFYRLILEPKPKLSLFLHVETLIRWYVTALDTEMSVHTESVLELWSDSTKDVSGMQDKYKYPIPWVPFREDGESGVFRTQIPEDLKDVLSNYLDWNKKLLSDANISDTFRRVVAQLNESVHLSYANAFFTLSKRYDEALGSKNWAEPPSTIRDEDEVGLLLVERFEWLCSVVDDARRIVTGDILIIYNVNSEKVASVAAKSYSCYFEVIDHAADHLTHVLFKLLALDSLWDDAEAHWSLLPPETAHKTSESSHTPPHRKLWNVLEEFFEFMSDKYGYMDSLSFYNLMNCSAEFFVVGYLRILRFAQKQDRLFDSDGVEVMQISADYFMLSDYFLRLMNKPRLEEYSDSINSQFRFLSHALVILSEDPSSSNMASTLQSISKLAEGHPEHAFALAAFVETMMSLRVDNASSSVTSIFEEFIASTREVGHELSSDDHSTHQRSPCYFIVFGADAGEERQKDNVQQRMQRSEKMDGGSTAVDSTKIQKKTGARRLFGGLTKAHDEFLRSRKIVIKSMVAYNLVSLSRTLKPRALLRFSIDRNNAQTSVKGDDLNPDWGEESLQLDLGSLSDNAELVCTLVYQGRLYGEDVVGTINIPLASIEISDIKEEHFSLRATNEKFHEAVQAATKEGRDGPSVKLSVSLLRE